MTESLGLIKWPHIKHQTAKHSLPDSLTHVIVRWARPLLESHGDAQGERELSEVLKSSYFHPPTGLKIPSIIPLGCLVVNTFLLCTSNLFYQKGNNSCDSCIIYHLYIWPQGEQITASKYLINVLVVKSAMREEPWSSLPLLFYHCNQWKIIWMIFITFSSVNTI